MPSVLVPIIRTSLKSGLAAPQESLASVQPVHARLLPGDGGSAGLLPEVTQIYTVQCSQPHTQVPIALHHTLPCLLSDHRPDCSSSTLSLLCQLLDVRVWNARQPDLPMPVVVHAPVNYSCFPPLLMYPRAITLGVATKKEMEVRPYDHPLLLNPAGFALLQFYTDNPNVATVTVRTEVRLHALKVRLLINRKSIVDGAH